MSGTIEDREAIRDVLAAYAHAIDRRRWEMMERLFHTDATFRFGLVQGDWRSFVDQARAIIDPCLATQHQLGQTLFGFEGDSLCHTETYMTAMHTIPPGYPMTAAFPDKGVIYSGIVAGRYVDRFEKRGGVWRIAKRVVVMDWNLNQPSTEIRSEGMFRTLQVNGSRDRQDPIYRR